MPETDKPAVKGIQVSKIAKEVNRESSEILEYLKRIGVEAKLMTKVDEPTYQKVLGHFKADVEEAKMHKQKLMDFKKKHKGIEITEIEGEVQKERERREREDEEQRKKEEEEGRVKQEQESIRLREAEEKEKLAKQKETDETKDTEEKKPSKEDKSEPSKKAEQKSEKKKEVPEQPEKESRVRELKGLTVVGKINLPAPEKRYKGVAPRRHDKKPGQRKEFDKTKPGEKPHERKFERVTIVDESKKPKRPQFKQRSPYKKPFVSRTDETQKKDDKVAKPVSGDSLEHDSKKQRDVDKKDKSKKQKYIDGRNEKKKTKTTETEVEHEIAEAIRETLAKIDEVGSQTSRAVLRKRKKKERIEEEKKQQEENLARANVLQVTEFLSASELATLMEIDVSQIIQKSFELGKMVTINQRLERDTIELLADDFGYKIEFNKEYEVDILSDKTDDISTLVHRPPVVTIMGHVDHGKTSLLDYIRKATVVAGEAGGITQHIGAYQVKLDNNKLITFLDTPGHEAFTAMRARGAQITDIVVLVVAADDSVMPQTVEAINHALAANVPIVVALNKIDKPTADPTKIKTQLSEKGILVEEWGGKYQSVEISAKTGLNIEQLLEKILLEAEVLDLKANPNREARGAVVEAKLDRGKGIVATVLVQKGTLNIGDSFIAGVFSGRVKAMYDERGHKVFSVKPATPVQVLGFDGMPQAGDVLVALESERDVKEISLKRQQLKREQDFRQVRFATLDDISKQIKEGKQVDLNVVIKGDVDGSVEALSDSLLKLETSEVKVRVIHKGIGEISENDVLLSAASNAIIIGFNVRPNLKARKLAEVEGVDIRIHNIIYNVINEIKLALEGLLVPDKKEEVLATVEVRDTFKVPKIGVIAGCHVVDGKISRSNKVRLLREGLTIFDGGIISLKRFKDDVRDVDAGFECGVGLENFNDIKVGDIIEAYKIVEIKRKLL